MKIAIGSDHAGFEYKEALRAMLTAAGHEVRDFGTHSTDPVDYPDFIAPAAEAVASGQCQRGIVLGGSGNGEAITANKIPGIRCALCWSLETARLSRLHNDANMISLGQRQIPVELALDIVRSWLATEFEGARHLKRIQGIAAVEGRYAAQAKIPELGPVNRQQMTTTGKMSFPFNCLIDQIIEGRKTASAEWMQRQGEIDEWDSALEVGSVYTVCDSQRTPRCTIRVTSIHLCRWDSIPEWLWKGETNDNPEEFRSDHLEYFDNPEQDFEFVGFEFELVNVIKTDT